MNTLTKSCAVLAITAVGNAAAGSFRYHLDTIVLLILLLSLDPSSFAHRRKSNLDNTFIRPRGSDSER